MEVNEFILKFKDQFIDGDDHVFTLATEFRKIESWDSLTGMAILVMVKDEYGIDMSDQNLIDCQTVGDIFNYVKEHHT